LESIQVEIALLDYQTDFQKGGLLSPHGLHPPVRLMIAVMET